MENTLAHKPGDMKVGLRFILCLPSVFVWLAAAFFALKWFGHIVRGTITYGNERAAIMVPLLSGLAFVGALGCLVTVAMTCFGKMKLRWQGIVFFSGLLFLLLIVGD